MVKKSPLLLLLVVLAVAYLAAGHCRHLAVDYDATGDPMDYAGNPVSCPICGTDSQNTDAHNYNCPRCRSLFAARYTAGAGFSYGPPE